MEKMTCFIFRFAVRLLKPAFRLKVTLLARGRAMNRKGVMASDLMESRWCMDGLIQGLGECDGQIVVLYNLVSWWRAQSFRIEHGK